MSLMKTEALIAERAKAERAVNSRALVEVLTETVLPLLKRVEALEREVEGLKRNLTGDGR